MEGGARKPMVHPEHAQQMWQHGRQLRMLVRHWGHWDHWGHWSRWFMHRRGR